MADGRAGGTGGTGNTGDASTLGSDRGPKTPIWVKVFGITALVLVLLMVIIMVSRGGNHGPGQHVPAGGTGGDTSAPSTHENIGGVGGPADASEGSRTVEVTALDTMSFQPSRITASAGETVTFVVTNAGRAVHEFTLGDAAMQQEHAAQMAHMPDGVAHDRPNTITLRPGETKQLTWRFGTGSLEYACHEPGHYEAGMRGEITVS